MVYYYLCRVSSRYVQALYSMSKLYFVLLLLVCVSAAEDVSDGYCNIAIQCDLKLTECRPKALLFLAVVTNTNAAVIAVDMFEESVIG